MIGSTSRGSPHFSSVPGACRPAKFLDVVAAELALASATPAASLNGSPAGKQPRARRRSQAFTPQAYSTADYRAGVASMIQKRNGVFGISADGGAPPGAPSGAVKAAVLVGSRPRSPMACGHIPREARRRLAAAGASFKADGAGDSLVKRADKADRARGRQSAAIDVCQGADSHAIAADAGPLPVAMRLGACDERLARLGASAECRGRWRAAAFARPADAIDFDRFLQKVEEVAGSALRTDYTLATAFARLLDRTAGGGPATLFLCAKHARAALRHQGDQVALGLNRSLVTALEQDIAQGAYDTDLRGLDHALRGLYRTEALRAAVEKRFDDHARDGFIGASGRKYGAQPLDIYLGLQRRLGPKLGLPGTLMTMIYPKLAGFTPADYDAVEQEVRESERRGFGVYLAAQSPHWRGVVARIDPEGSAAAQAARLALREQCFAADVDAYCAAHPRVSRDAACRAVEEAHAWRAFAPLMRKHLAPHGLWPLNRAPLERWIYALCYRMSASLSASLSADLSARSEARPASPLKALA